MNKDYSQCRPTSALLEAFVHTQPSAKHVEEFLKSGKTHFSAAGLAPYSAAPGAAAVSPTGAATTVVVEEETSGCPGGGLAACMGACPSSPLSAYGACARVCSTRCSKQLNVA